MLVADGAFRSLGLTAYAALAYADVGPARMNAANTLAATLQQLSFGLGVALAVLALRLGDLVSSGTGAYAVASHGLAGLLVVPLLEALALPADAGDALRRTRPALTRPSARRTTNHRSR